MSTARKPPAGASRIRCCSVPDVDAHAALDAAVLDAYGFKPDADLLQQLLELNLTVAARLDTGQPVTAPGVPPSYGDSRPLITDDCIRP